MIDEETGEAPDDESGAAEMLARLESLGQALAAKRSEVIQARAACGIEQIWLEDEEYYNGIDDANRGEQTRVRDGRPVGQRMETPGERMQSTVFPNITRPYVNAASAKISDILMPSDRPAFGLEPTPIPDMLEATEGDLPAPLLDQIGEKFAGQPGPAADAAEDAVKLATEMVDVAKAKAEKAKKRIEDWHVECQFHAQARLMLKDGAKIGTGVMKGPCPERRKTTAIMGQAVVIEEEIQPVSRRVSAWDVYPDWPACGENVHDGSFIFERANITARRLQDLKGGDCIDSQIDLVLAEGPTRAIEPSKRDDQVHYTEPRKGPFEIWYFYGDLTREDMEAAGCECGEDFVSVPAMVTMVNNRVIKAAMNPLDSGDFPYDFFPWLSVRPGMPWGTGIARDGREGQRLVVGGARRLMDNAGIASGPMWIAGRQVKPINGVWEIAPWKGYQIAEDGDIDDVRKAFSFIEMPMKQAELQNIMQIGMKMMEDTTGMPMLMQGQMGSAPDTVGGMEILNTNASAFLREIGRVYDDYITEPHVRRYYAWLLQYGNDDEKGDFQIDARGSSTNVERALQNQELVRMVQLCLNPAYKKDPAKAMDEYLTSRHFDPKKFAYDDEEWQKIVANLGKPPPDPRVQIEQMRIQDGQQRYQADQQAQERLWAYESAEKEKDRQNKIAIEMIDERMTSAELTSLERQVLAKIKAALAETTIKINAQRELSAQAMQDGVDRHAADIAVDLHKHGTPRVVGAPTEPAGRAMPGRAYQQ